MKSFLDILEEEKQGEKHHAMTFGRMNPPTTGHLKLIDKVKEVAKKHNAEHSVVASHTQDSKKNPLSSEQKIKHLKRYSPGTHFVSASKEHPTIMHHAAELHKKGVTHLHVVVGSDRAKEMHHLLHKYNGAEAGHGKYHFKKITVHSAGHRDPDAEGTEGMSGTKMREHAKNKDIHSFKKGVPSHVSDAHAKELMHDTRKGMGLHEDASRGQFRAIFVTGGPGSGKDVIIRESIAESRIVELNFIQARDYLADKQKLSEKSNDYRREALRNRGPLIINGPADDNEKINYIKEELEELGYETMMIFVNTTNEVSKERNSLLSRMMVESVRQDKWLRAQENTKYFTKAFNSFITFDNTGKIDNKEEDLHEIYQTTKVFLDSKVINETVEDWIERNKKLDVNVKINLLFKENKNVQSPIRLFKNKTKTGSSRSGVPADNFPSDPNSGDIKWDANRKPQGSYVFRTYEEKEPKVQWKPEAQEPNFQKDKEKVKNKKRFTDSPTASQRMRNVTALGPEFDTRQQGTVYPMSGLGDVTYREQKDFNNFRKVIKEYKGFQNDVESGLGGVLSGADNKEPMDSYKDPERNIINDTTKKKKKK
jgi:cytidyltransferase-like protein